MTYLSASRKATAAAESAELAKQRAASGETDAAIVNLAEAVNQLSVALAEFARATHRDN